VGELLILARAFDPSRWLAEWEALGGTITLGPGGFGKDGKRIVGMAEFMAAKDGSDSERLAKIESLRRQIRGSTARLRVIDVVVHRALNKG
jgi:hypothetical protein